MDTYPAEPHIETPPEDTPCTVCDGAGYTATMKNHDGPSEIKTKCFACDGTGSGYIEWLGQLE